MGARAVGNPRRGLNAPARGLRTLHAAVWRALLPGRPCLQVAWSNQLDSKPPKSHSCPYKAPPRLPNSHVLHERDGCWISLCSCHKSAQSVVARYRPRVVQGLKANSFQSLSCRIRAPNEFILFMLLFRRRMEVRGLGRLYNVFFESMFGQLFSRALSRFCTGGGSAEKARMWS